MQSTSPDMPGRKERRKLMEQVDVQNLLRLSRAKEQAWIDVIRKMDEVYADLIRYEVELEEKNAALEDAQRLIAGVLASMSDVLIVCDMQGRIQRVNKALEDLTGHMEAALIGRPVEELVPADCRSQMEALKSGLSAETPLWDREVCLEGCDGQPMPLAMNCTARCDSGGRMVGMVFIGRPVGELRRAYEALNKAHNELRLAQQQLVQSEKMASLGRLVAGVAHELNNPISVVYGNMHALSRYSERIRRYLDAVHGNVGVAERERLREELRIDRLLEDLDSLIQGTMEGAERVSHVVQDLKRFSASRRGAPEVFGVAENIRNAVQWACKGMRRPVDIMLDLEDDLQAMGHPGQLHQVVVNVVQNALDAVQEAPEPRVEISVRRVDGMVEMVFRDNGPGIAEEDLLRVFDPFFSTKPVGKGTGLGLSISYGIIKDLGGSFEAGNDPRGGARFVIRLPAVENA